MQSPNFSRVVAGFTLVSLLVACTGLSDSQYASLKDVPLVSAGLHAVTVVTDDATLSQSLEKDGYTAIRFSSNYPASDRVEASLWSVPEPVVARAGRLRANDIPVIFDPVAITTAYLGDHKTMAIRAPDGTIVELVETAAQ